MIWMPKVFSDNALFLHSAPLELYGRTDAAVAVTASIERDGKIFCRASVESDPCGAFRICLSTPGASYQPYTINVCTENDTYLMKGVLFGELWFAAGQSNMQMSNGEQPQWRHQMQECIRGKHLRFFSGPRPEPDAEYPLEPVQDTDGWWVTPGQEEAARAITALGTAFTNHLYDFLRSRGEEVPVGILNCNRGGTNIETWLPREAFEAYDALKEYAPDPSSWNQCGTSNYAQPTAHFNYNTFAHLGVKVRGVLWYQGEYNLCTEQRKSIYKDFLVALRESYQKLFGTGEDERFPLICSQIYPYRYSDNDESFVGYFNQCFSDLAKQNPDAYAFVPVCDLSPIWNYHSENHPIHPAHKYQLGERFALLTENLCYSRGGARAQKSPATLKSCTRHGNRLRLVFENVGKGIWIKGDKARGLYIRSSRGAYVPAECEIVNKSTLLVSNPTVNTPKFVAYAVSSHEAETNLMAGEFPIAPFCTEFTERTRSVMISRKPWLDLSLDGDFAIADDFADAYRNAGVFPNYSPLAASVLCYDKVIARSARSLRIIGSESAFGAYIVARVGASLDFENYSALYASVYNASQVHLSLRLVWKGEGETMGQYVIDGEVIEDLGGGFHRVRYDLTAVPKQRFSRAEFLFEQTAQKVPFVNLDELLLVARA